MANWEQLAEAERDFLFRLAEGTKVTPKLIEEMVNWGGSTGGYPYAKAILITLIKTGHLAYMESAAEYMAIEQGEKWSPELRARVNAPVKEASMTRYEAYCKGLIPCPSYEDQDLPYVK